MDLNLYQYDSSATARGSMPDMTEKQKRLLNWAVGLGEVGELQNLIKKHVYHGHDLDVDAVLDEMGDVLWYLAQIATTLDVPLSDVATLNIHKLRNRYPQGFSPERSINR
jgi:NTP pyrophosphatase (non-canonical NTP hydrolase)